MNKSKSRSSLKIVTTKGNVIHNMNNIYHESWTSDGNYEYLNTDDKILSCFTSINDKPSFNNSYSLNNNMKTENTTKKNEFSFITNNTYNNSNNNENNNENNEENKEEALNNYYTKYILVSNDKNMRLKALARNINAFSNHEFITFLKRKKMI